MPATSPPRQRRLRLTIDCFWDTFPPLWSGIREHLREVVLADLDLTVEQFHVMRHIRQGTRSVSELAAARRISRPGISQAVEVLVSKGVIARRASAHDRRCVRLELTPHGNTLLDAVFQKNRAWMARRLARLTPRELDAIQVGLLALAGAFEGPDAQAGKVLAR